MDSVGKMRPVTDKIPTELIEFTARDHYTCMALYYSRWSSVILANNELTQYPILINTNNSTNVQHLMLFAQKAQFGLYIA